MKSLSTLLFTLSLAYSIALSAQRASEFTLIFKISAAEAETLYRHETDDIYSEPYLYHLIDSFKTSAPVLPVGHYLFVRAAEEALEIVQHSIHAHRVATQPGTNDLRLEVLDSNGRTRKDARLTFNHQEITWDKTAAIYRHQRPREDGWLRVAIPGDTLIYRIDHRKVKPQRKRFFRTPIGYLISTPYRWAHNTYRYFRGAIKWGEWRIRWRRIWPFPKKNRNLKGYIAMSQPRYRPGDTLRVKTYLTKRNGKPWNEAIQFELRGYRNQLVVTRSLSPDRPGAFSTEVVLADTLKLDQYYYLRFFVAGQANKYGIKNQNFILEDYQLEAAKFAFSSSAGTYHYGTPIRFEAAANDFNGNPLPGAAVELIALRRSVKDIGPDSLLIPDTLWTHRQDLSLRETNDIPFPDSLLPPADFDIQVQAFFTTAGGESEQKSVQLSYFRASGEIDAQLDTGQWTFRYLQADTSVEQAATLIVHRLVFPFRDTLNVTLPYQLAANANVNHYSLFTKNGVRKTVSAQEIATPISVVGQHLGDSLLVRLDNPHGLNVRYQLYAGKTLELEGETTGDLLLGRKAHSKPLYQFAYQYVWSGQPKSGEQTFRTYKNQLQVSADLPNRIYPGQTVQVKVKATDHKARPAQGVDLVAGAVNGQFESRDHLTPPQITYRDKKGRRQKHRYTAQRAGNQHEDRIGKKWYRHLSLDTMLYYNIRYPENGVFTQMDTLEGDSFYLRHPQISPYVVKSGQLQPVYFIYLNREVVYSHLSQDNSPYAFTARPGYNQLKIRTLNAEYRIDSVWIAPGHKLSFALDETFYGLDSIYGRHVKRTSAPDYLRQGEVALLNQTMLRIRKEERNTTSYLAVDSTRIYRWPQPRRTNAPTVIGPVPANRPLTYLQRDGWENTFFYEPGYIYEVRENRERLYENRYIYTGKKHGLVKELPHPEVNELALIPKDIIKVSPRVRKVNFRQGWKPIYNEEGAMQLFYGQDGDSTLVAISLQNINGSFSLYAPNQRYFSQLPQGYYELSLITAGGATSRRKCWIYPDQLQVLDLRGAAFVQDTSIRVLDELYTYSTTKPSFLKFPKSNNTSSPTVNPYEGTGYLAGGVMRDQETGEPLLFANVLLVGTDIGTITDLDGNWSLWVPDISSVLEFSYTGYQSSQLKAGLADETIALAAGEMLDEVVVIGYSVPLIEQDNTTQAMTISSSDIRRLPTRNINAMAATAAGISMVDEGDRINVRGSRDGTTNYYIDGVRVQGNLLSDSTISLLDANGGTLNLNGRPGSSLLPGGGLRTDFRDYGFWQPDLITDQKGEAYFQVTFPDDITRWQTFLLGMDDQKRGGAWYGETSAFRPVMAQLFLPRFLLPGDEVELVGSSVNYTNDTFQIDTRLELDGEVVLHEKHELVDGLTDKVEYTTLPGRDSLTAKYTLQTGNYLEGEERSIPLFRVGTEETIGGFHRLEGDTSLQLAFDPKEGPVTIYAQPDLLHVMLNELEALIDYPYACNEQSASRLLALLMQKEVYALTGRTFEHEAAIQKMVALLRQRQRPDGSWGWWAGSPRNQWMTVYVVRALHAAKEAGYATEALEKGLTFLTNHLNYLQGKDRLATIALLSEVGQNMDYSSLLAPYDTLPGLNWMTLTTTLIQVQQNLPYQLDTLAKYRQETLFGGHYWGKPGYGFYRNEQQYSLLAYRVLRAAGEQDALAPIRQYFTEQRHRSPGYHWRAGYRNTFEAAMILKTIMPELMAQYADQATPDFQQRLEIIADDRVSWDTLPQQITLDATQAIRIRKTGVGTTYFTAYQRRWNERPQRVEGPFVVSSILRQGDETTETLAAGRPAEIRVVMEVEKSSDYVLLEIPIPAGCSYGSKRNSTRYRNNETHREYFRDKVAIFCEHLEPGTYTYTVELEPRFNGRFQLNPAKAEQMYFPIFYGREGMKEIFIKG